MFYNKFCKHYSGKGDKYAHWVIDGTDKGVCHFDYTKKGWL